MDDSEAWRTFVRDGNEAVFEAKRKAYLEAIGAVPKEETEEQKHIEGHLEFQKMKDDPCVSPSKWELEHIRLSQEELRELRDEAIKQKTDNVTKPSHYQILPGVEMIDVRKALLNKIPEGASPFAIDCWSRSFEYLGRMWGKNGLEDAKKARVYLDWLINEMEG